MFQIDLIPVEYRQIKKIRKLGKIMVLGLCFIVAMTSLTYYRVKKINGENELYLEEINNAQKAVENRSSQLKRLRKEKGELSETLSVLKSINKGLDIKAIFQAFDNALNPGVWFNKVDASVAQETIPKETMNKNSAIENQGYLIVISNKSESEPTMMRIRSKITVKGQAKNHSDLASFVNHLLEQPIIDTTQIQHTSTRKYTRFEVIDFTLNIILKEPMAIS